jgi:hypothetical protein
LHAQWLLSSFVPALNVRAMNSFASRDLLIDCFNLLILAHQLLALGFVGCAFSTGAHRPDAPALWECGFELFKRESFAIAGRQHYLAGNV